MMRFCSFIWLAVRFTGCFFYRNRTDDCRRSRHDIKMYTQHFLLPSHVYWGDCWLILQSSLFLSRVYLFQEWLLQNLLRELKKKAKGKKADAVNHNQGRCVEILTKFPVSLQAGDINWWPENGQTIMRMKWWLGWNEWGVSYTQKSKSQENQVVE